MCAYVYIYVLCVHVSMCVCVCVICVYVGLSSLLQSPALHRVYYLSSHPTLSHRTCPPFLGRHGIAGTLPKLQGCSLILTCQPALGAHNNCIVRT